MNNHFDESTKLVIASLGKPVGLKGQIKLHPQSDFLTQFKKGASFRTKDLELTIESFDQNRMLVVFVGYDSIEKVKELVAKELYSTIEESRASCKLGSEEYFWFDIISCEIIENEEVLGIVEDIERFTGQDFMSITTDEKLVEQKLPKIFMLPYSDRYIISVDLQNKKISVKNAKDILEAS